MEQSESIGLKAVFFGLLAAVEIPAEHAGYLLAAIFVDSVFGMLKAIKLKCSLSFKTFIWGITSKISLLFIPFLIATFGLAFGHDLAFLVSSFIYIIAANETVSIISKIATLRTGKAYKNEDFVTKAIEMLRDFFVSKMQGLIEDSKKH